MVKKHRAKAEVNFDRAPLLSNVESTAVQLWLDYEIEKTCKQIQIWRTSARRSSDPGTLASLAHHRAAYAAYRASRARLAQIMDAREAAGKTPPAAQVAATVIDRQRHVR